MLNCLSFLFFALETTVFALLQSYLGVVFNKDKGTVTLFAFDKEIDSTRTDKELVELKQNTIELIDTIENEEVFPTNPSGLCDWCEFKPVCKQWSHLYKLEGKPANEYLNDDGVKLVNRYAELKNKKKQIELDIYSELEKLEEAIKHFAEKENVDVVFGSKNKIRIKETKIYVSYVF